MTRPASRDPMHYKITEALDGPLSDGSAQNADLLVGALRAVMAKLAEHEGCCRAPDCTRVRFARDVRLRIAEPLGLTRPWQAEPPKVER